MRKDGLIVDDEPAIRRLLTTALSRSGITHVEAANAAEALRLAAAQPAPLVRCSISVCQTVTGWRLCRNWRS